jgi:hypothetical protein
MSPFSPAFDLALELDGGVPGKHVDQYHKVRRPDNRNKCTTNKAGASNKCG